jgi:membrane protease YdiL (CAAX protease family)
LRELVEAGRMQQGLLGPGDRVALLLMACVGAPIVEEWIFRGLLLRGLRGVLAPVSALLLSSLVFAVVHPPIAFPPVFVMGLAAALTVERTGNLRAAMLLHAGYNAGVLLVLPLLT